MVSPVQEAHEIQKRAVWDYAQVDTTLELALLVGSQGKVNVGIVDWRYRALFRHMGAVLDVLDVVCVGRRH